MGLSMPKSKNKAKRTKPTIDQEFRKLDLKLRKLAQAELIKRAQADPEIMNKIFEREFGIKIPAIDPIKKQRDKLRTVIADEAVTRIEKDPKLAATLTTGWIATNASELGIQFDSPDVRWDKQLNRLKQTHEMMEILGVSAKKSFWDELKDPQVIVAILGFLEMLIPLFRSNPKQSEKTFALTIDGQRVEMSIEEFKAFILTGSKGEAPSQAPHTAGAPFGDTREALLNTDEFNYNPDAGIQPIVVGNRNN